MSKKIDLTQGKIAIVDDDDYARLCEHKWTAQLRKNTGKWVAVTRLERTESGVPGKLVLMHRFIMNPPKELQVDHRNSDPLDNQKINLRVCSNAENARNRGKQRDNTSGYKGVGVWKDGRWQCAIKLHGKRIFLGIFDDPAEAARAYDRAAIIYHGEFAKLNFPSVKLPGNAGMTCGILSMMG